MTRSFEQEWPNLDLRAGALPFRSNLATGTELLTRRRKGQPFWSLPKGHLMADHALYEVAAIEASRLHPHRLNPCGCANLSTPPSILAWPERRQGSVDNFAFPSRVDRAGHLSTRREI